MPQPPITFPRSNVAFSSAGPEIGRPLEADPPPEQTVSLTRPTVPESVKR
jgi:hypothetical protein